ncbi:hypothetical protein BC941DRAFT_488353, partial [Chlamydoabsidia padenii]
CSKNINAMTQGDLDSIQGCSLFTGTITIDNSSAEELVMRGVEEISGNLILSGNLLLRQFQAPQLSKVKGELRIVNQTVLGKLQLPMLTQSNVLNLSVLPALEHLDFPAGLSVVEDAHIEDTRAPTVNGFNPEHMHSFALISNNYMKQFDFSSVKNLSGTLHVASNGNSLEFQANQLVSVETMDFRNVAQLSLPQLTHVSGDATFHGNNFDQLHIDQIELVKGTLTITNNERLVTASLQHLAKVGGAFSIGNNPQLVTIDGFPALNEVDGTIDIAGNFETYALPGLQDVRGGMRLQTTSSKIQCDELERKMKAENVVKGTTWSCSSSMDESQLEPTLGQEGSVRFPGTKGLANENGGQKGTIEDNNAKEMNGANGGLVPAWGILVAGCIAALGF